MAIAAAAAAALAAHAGLAAALRVPVAPACLEPSLLPAHADQSDERHYAYLEDDSALHRQGGQAAENVGQCPAA